MTWFSFLLDNSLFFTNVWFIIKSSPLDTPNEIFFFSQLLTDANSRGFVHAKTIKFDFIHISLADSRHINSFESVLYLYSKPAKYNTWNTLCKRECSGSPMFMTHTRTIHLFLLEISRLRANTMKIYIFTLNLTSAANNNSTNLLELLMKLLDLEIYFWIKTQIVLDCTVIITSFDIVQWF